ncbi:MAG: AAA family ATPase [Tolumonas sp.]|nr:AAA family ATPase [Tolumonas sp.]
MKIAHIDIQNFRKLKSCRVELAEESTIFVGANNSGKTTAMDALIMFLKKSKNKEITTTDINLSNWTAINRIGEEWISADEEKAPDLSLTGWRAQFPTIDLWLKIRESQIHYVSHILPTLDWDGGLLGVRLILEPKDPENLYKAYVSAHSAAKETMAHRATTPRLTLWPTSMHDFLDRKLHDFFTVSTYILDPSLVHDAQPQPFTEMMEALDSNPLDGLFKIDIINAQRGFSDPNSGEGAANTDRRLSTQLRHYYDKHLDPYEMPDASDLDALEAMETARIAFDEKLNTSFSSAIKELEGLNYPGFSDPQIRLASKVNSLDGLNHDSAVQFNVVRRKDLLSNEFCLPEKYNGLGYQNLISMIFNLIRFRDEWMRVGKIGKRQNDYNKPIEPLHLMLIEEPEAHLHAQVQQVFIKKAFSVLRDHPDLGQTQQFSTQIVVSTHSSHIAHETDFTGLRYFRRLPLANDLDVPSACVVNMSTTFGDNRKKPKKGESTDETKEQERIATAQFATRYLKTTHCDLFFADGVVLVEGPAERMLVPHFIRNHHPELDQSYISLLEIGGSHAHRLRPLIEALGIPTLVITDLDSIKADSNAKALPERSQNLRTGNDTLKTWAPEKEALDEVLNSTSAQKISSNGMVRVAYPCETRISFSGDGKQTAIPYTFEDALVLANLPIFREMAGKSGLIKKMIEATNKKTLKEACESMFEALDKNAKKAEMALDLLYSVEPSDFKPPQYIEDGLLWLKSKLSNNTLTAGMPETQE